MTMMNITSETACLNGEHMKSIAIGKPRFSEKNLDSTATQQGILSAWLQAFKDKGVRAPETVSGDFAIAFCEPDGRTFLAIDRFAIRSTLLPPSR
jgi:asparagine synthase (glutamine-hydrolysing)